MQWFHANFSICFAASLFLIGCAPKYPKCDKDEHCQKGEFCVNGMCQQCRTDQDCKEGTRCQSGACVAKCRTNDDCPNQQACKDGRCSPCTKDLDCGPGGSCIQSKCVKGKKCASNSDCPPNYECHNGICIAPPQASGAPAPCKTKTVYFDFNESILPVEATNTLKENSECIQSNPKRKLTLEGHCDPRGTDEYNIALGDRRAQSVKRYLIRLGVKDARLRTLSKGKLEATGTKEDTWALDRKVKFIWE